MIEPTIKRSTVPPHGLICNKCGSEVIEFVLINPQVVVDVNKYGSIVNHSTNYWKSASPVRCSACGAGHIFLMQVADTEDAYVEWLRETHKKFKRKG